MENGDARALPTVDPVKQDSRRRANPLQIT